MVKETSTSKLLLLKKENELSSFIRSKYGVNLFLAEITGRRWSYITGRDNVNAVSFLFYERIRLDRHFGIVAEGWQRIPDEKKDEFISVFKKMVEEYGKG